MDIGRSDNFRGYMAILTENNNPDNKGEMHEAFNLGLDPILAPEAFAEQEALKAKGISDGLEHSENLWPAPETYPAAVEFVSWSHCAMYLRANIHRNRRY